MRRRDLILAAGALAVAPCTVASAVAAPVVVLELFTSQGCSSCPPAEALLTELAPRPGVVALAWHVDYWNNLGWRDPYASRDWTERQRRYAAQMNAEVYTPALAINGTRMVVGSDRSAVRSAIGSAQTLPVTVELRRTDEGLAARVGPRPEAATVTLVVYDKARATSVGAGENSGRTLKEGHIVRSATLVEAASGDVALSLPGIAPDQGAVLLIQDHELAILGAAQVRAAGAAVT